MSVSMNETCIGCGACIAVCPGDALRMNEDTKIPYVKYPDDCQLCKVCQFECPTNAITITPEKECIPVLSWG